MKQAFALLRRSRTLWAALLSAILTLGVVAGVAATSATATRVNRPDVAAPPAVPTKASQIQNIDQVKTAIKGYYGDTLTTTPDPVTGTTMLHEPSAASSYATEVEKLEKYAKSYLDYKAYEHGKKVKPAIILDVDDTSLVTYDYEIYSNFVYSPTSNAAFVNGEVFPAVFGMPSLAKRAVKDGYTVFFLTGRPSSQQAATIGNLAKVGFPSVPASQVYTKDLTNPIYSSCAPTCTTIQYKSLTRAYIESLGYKIFANFGDQNSDLSGGYAKKTFKLPNPMYYLP